VARDGRAQAFVAMACGVLAECRAIALNGAADGAANPLFHEQFGGWHSSTQGDVSWVLREFHDLGCERTDVDCKGTRRWI
jgi:hypothetical protein